MVWLVTFRQVLAVRLHFVVFQLQYDVN